MLNGDGSNISLALHGDDTVDGGAGNDTLVGGGGHDSLLGGDGNDALQGDSGNDTLNGGDGIDALMGGDGNDLLYGGAGDDGFTGTGNAKQANGGLLNGGDGNDTIYGGSGQDALVGDAGDDLLFGDDGDDQLEGRDGNDSLQGGSGLDVLAGGAGNDTYLLTGGGYDTIIDGEGYDTLILENTSIDEVQILQFGSVLQINVGQEALVVIEDGFLGTIDRFKFGQTNVYLEDLQPQNLNLTPSQVSRATYKTQDSPSGEAPNTEIDPNDLDLRGLLKLATNGFVINGDERTNTLYGGGGSDSISAFASNDIVHAAGGHDVVDGGIGADFIDGEEGNDSLVGGDDRDTLIGGVGNDTLVGGGGNDRYVFAQGFGTDVIDDQSSDTSTDNVIAFSHELDKDAINVLQHGANLVLEIPGGSQLTVKNYFANGASGIFQIQFSDGAVWNITDVKRRIKQTSGTEGSDTLSAEYDEVLGWSKPVYLDGKEGNDFITGGSGNDTLKGGDGSDLLRGSQGDDLIIGDGGLTQGEGDSIDAAEGNDTIIGGGGEDTINGGFGDDTYIYRLGETGDIINGQYDFDNNAIEVDGTPSSIRFVRPFYDRKDLIVLMQNGGPNEYSMVIDDLFLPFQTSERNTFAVRIKGNDTVYSWDDILRLMLTPTSGNDPLWGTYRSESLYGAGGNDDLHGWAGNDTLNGGFGFDTLEGGLGDDVYLVEAGQKRDVINEESGADTVRFGVGVDTGQLSLVRSGDNLFVSSSDGRVQLRVSNHFKLNNATRSSAVEFFEFSNGAVWNISQIDSLALANSADTMIGSAADDIYVYDNIGDRIVEAENAGNDTVQASLDFIMAGIPNIENIEVIGSLDVRLEGNALSNKITGNLADNLLHGGEGGNDTLIGGMGDDTLSGYFSNDTLLGGLGNDYYIFSKDFRSTNGYDEHFAIELAGEGNDTLFSYRYNETLPGNIENLVMGSLNYGLSSPRQFIGNDLDNIIDGRRSESFFVNNATVLDGGLGADTLYGDVLTSDTYVIDRLEDLIIEPTGNPELSVDTVQSPISYALGANIENLVLFGNSAISATGNELNNVLDGSQNSASNVLYGLAGDDTYIIDTGDVVVEEVNSGSDTLVLSSYGQTVRVSDYVNIENIKLENYISTSLFGDDADNKLWGGYSVTNIEGGGGNDTIWDVSRTGLFGQIKWSNYMSGGSGDDIIFSIHGRDTVNGGTGNDALNGYSFLYNRGDGNDTISARYDTGYESGSTGNVIFGDGIALEDLQFDIVGADLRITFKSGDGEILVKSQFSLNASGNYFAGVSLIFADGTEIEERIVRAIALNSSASTQGNDDLVGAAGDDFIDGFDGDDLIYGLAGNDTLAGGAGNDLVKGGADNDSLSGGDGLDTLTGEAGNDFLDGGLANDSLVGGAGNDVLRGGEGNDSLIGDVGDDQLFDEGGNDSIQGGDGNDTLFAGIGNDSLSGGKGADVFRFDVGFGQDTISWDAADGLPATEGDWIEFGQGITLANITLTSNYASESVVSLKITLNGTSDSLLAYNSSGHFNAYLRGIRFANGSELSIGDIEQLTGMGTNGNDSLVGDGSNNYLRGLAGNDTLNAGDGNDTLDGGEGGDALIGGSGDDLYLVDNLGDTITEETSAGYDIAKSSVDFTLPNEVERLELLGSAALNGTGNESANYLLGNAGNNVLDGKGGADTMDGGTGSDTYYVDNTLDVISDSSTDYQDIDTVISSVTYTLSNSVENLTLTGGNSINGTGNSLNNVLRGNSGTNVLKGADGSDTYYVSTGDSVVENLDQGWDWVHSDVTFTLGANIEELYLTGATNINGTGNTLNNNIYGNAGNNILDGKAGDDWMVGGAGNDTYIQDSEGDAAIEEIIREALDPLTGETFYYRADVGGIDTVKSSANVGGVNEDDGTLWGLGNYVENLELTGTTAQLGYGNDIANNILGNSAANMLRGFEGNDTLNGAGGADTMFGGIGDDTYVVDVVGDVVTENAGEGIDLVQSSITYSLASSAEIENLTLTGTSAINGTGNAKDNILVGNSANNTLTGGAGNDRLDGGTGNDTMVGGTGNDTYVVNISTDVVTENLNEGIDTVEASATYSIASLANVENLTLTGTSAINATGNAAANVLTGNSGANTLNGGAGIDTLVGGAGNDTYVVDNAGDVITENASEGTDLVNASLTFSLANFANVENLTLTGTSAINATGNAMANTLTGNSGNNVLDGGAGNDTMVGGAGNDTYIVDSLSDVVTEASSAGSDTIQANLTYTIASLTNVENLTLIGSASINATGNTLANKLIGNSGNNRIDGGTGNDTMIGGAGNDTYVFNVATDVVTENANEGIDGIETNITLSLAAINHVENLTLTGTSAVNATGNALDNVLKGNSANNKLTGGAGNDRLDGGTGNDTMLGGSGNDTYVVNVSTDVVTENANEGTDTVESSITYSIASLANLEHITLTGSTAINATGNASANALIGNSGVNVLTGGAGNDTLDGAAGNDSLVGGTGNDTYVLGRGYGADTVTENDSTAGNTDVASFMSRHQPPTRSGSARSTPTTWKSA
jgi:Ca2+-binding RTX toxin-like protein